MTGGGLGILYLQDKKGVWGTMSLFDVGSILDNIVIYGRTQKIHPVGISIG